VLPPGARLPNALGPDWLGTLANTRHEIGRRSSAHQRLPPPASEAIETMLKSY